ncbi:MAG: hypothetical protein C7B45_16755 [Sulfobacillus acidophilus]|uniref:DUF6671 domain-containing protein n=1 Tax=Sulfobacillus acidophilus TaxID=53633 RepID=A0A2T2WCV9_9FIRM|nr:MAG: hypothetical protein C7B45_16755 [Sulfobacillus acidophilus]
MSERQSIPHPYQGRRVVLATKHQKEHVLGPPLKAALGLDLCVPDDLDTDRFGTFSGDIARQGTPWEVAVRKARQGMKAVGIKLGLASEGSFGPHPQLLFIPSDYELLAFVDDELGIEIVEQVLTVSTNFAHAAVGAVEELEDFFTMTHFPSHGLIVRPNSGLQPGLLFKGITKVDELEEAVGQCSRASTDGLAHVETDMRAHMNPTRQKVLREVAVQLARRLATLCPECRAPGWGLVDVARGLPCEWCGAKTDLVRREIYGCPRCDYRENYPRSDGLEVASAGNCRWCNP